MKKSRVKISSLKNINLDNNICVKGWVRTKRQGKNAPPKKHHIGSRKSGSTVFLKRPPTTRLDTAIALYMPQSLSVI